jgi:DNA-binding NtrC family response regulator
MHSAALQGTTAFSVLPSSQYRSSAYQAVLLRLDRFARDDTAPILIVGESGTGKTTLARRVHAASPRGAGPFEHVVLSALADGIASSALFGHIVGAFTDARHNRVGHFASASGGTLFLDELGKASRTLQAMLLHALEYGIIRPVGSDRDVRVTARVVAATNADLDDLAARGEFLPDLLARLSAFRIRVPPLRERRADIPELVHECLVRHSRAAGYAEPPGVHDELLEALRRARWPDNLRQLDGVVHRLLLEAEGASCLTLAHCTAELSYIADLAAGRTARSAEIEAVVAKTRGNLSAAARLLGIDRKTLRKRRRRGDQP